VVYLGVNQEEIHLFFFCFGFPYTTSVFFPTQNGFVFHDFEFFLVLKGVVQQQAKKKEAFFCAWKLLWFCRDVFECLPIKELFVDNHFFFFAFILGGDSTLK